ncbi:MAG: cyanophycinase [Chloroflexota bacterium]
MPQTDQVNSTQIGPTTGSLVLVGGGRLKDPTILHRFVTLAGGPSAPIVIVPTAAEEDYYGPYSPYLENLVAVGASQFTVLHTRDRKEADSVEFVRPLEEAQGVWFSGGRQWRLADSYLHTRTHEALQDVLNRGGVLGGTSAGATILGDFLVRGDTAGNELMIGDHQKGFGFLSNVTVDQHLLRRNRQFDLIAVIKEYPHLLGIGIDEDTAIVVRGNHFEVIGNSYVAIYDAESQIDPDGLFYFLAPGDRFDMHTRETIHSSRDYTSTERVIKRSWN